MALQFVAVAGNGDLIRSIRAGGGSGLAAAQELVRRAQAGTVSTAELKEVQKVISAPELSDVFRAVAGELSAATTGGGRVFRDVSSLTPDTERLTDARTLPERFLSDLKLVDQELFQHPGMTRAEKAERAFTFFESYAGRFQQLATGTAQARQAAQAQAAVTGGGALATTETGLKLAPPLTEAEMQKTLAQFDKALQHAGFNELRTDDGRTGAEAARQMLEAKTPEAQLQARPASLDAPSWKDNAAAAERSMKTEIERGRRTVQLDGHPQIQPQLRVQTTRSEETQKKEEARRSSSTDKVLGGNMLWNVLHLLRGDDLTDVARKDAYQQLAIAAVLLLILGGILVGVLVWM